MTKKDGKNTSICFAASTGGHFEQLMMLEPLMSQFQSFIIAEKTSYKPNTKQFNTYYLRQVNRKEKLALLHLLVNTFDSFRIFIKEKPDVVITTGVLAMIPICLIAKLFGKKLIYIESFAKVNSPTQTGRLLYKFADRFYVQWESMLEFYPKAIYKGGIY